MTYFKLFTYLFGETAEYDQFRDVWTFVTVVYEMSNFYCRILSSRIIAQIQFTIVVMA